MADTDGPSFKRALQGDPPGPKMRDLLNALDAMTREAYQRGCEDRQREIDTLRAEVERLWTALLAAQEEGPCGRCNAAEVAAEALAGPGVHEHGEGERCNDGCRPWGLAADALERGEGRG